MDFNGLSVFMPAFNEEANIAETVEKTMVVLKKLPVKDYELIVVNDGSKDKTLDVLEDLKKKYPKLKIVNHVKNKGYGEALKSGFAASRFDLIAYIDSDGQFDFSEISKFLDKIQDADIVVGYRINRQDPLLRKFNGWGWTMMNNLLFGLNVRDIDCAFKLLRKDVIESIPKLESERGGMISPELLAKAKKKGFKIVEVGVHHYPRTAGHPTGGNLKVIINSFKDLFKLRLKLN